ncbi:lipopolysaccharide biosynthesis protein [Pseudonocardia sp.]|uniref:lipopolysaccharide biosynthesis protein n=1 Tax=Pseudonocardia sp. TaxID=60912 RepID=UPI003D13995E
MRGVVASAEARYLFSKAVPGAVSFVSVILYVRFMGEYQYGLASLYLAGAAVAANILTGWTRQALLRESGAHRVDDVPTWVLITVCVVAAPFVIGLGVVSTGSDTTLPAVIAGGLFAVVSCAQSLALADVQSAQMPGVYARLEIIRALVGFALGIVACLVLPFAWGLLVALAGGMVAGTFRGKRVAPATRRILSRAEVGEWWRYGWPMAFWLAGSTIVQFADRFVITAVNGPAAAGHYSALYDIVVRGAGMVLIPFVLAGHPRVMALWNDDRRAEAVVECRSMLRKQNLLSAVVLVLGAAASPLVARIIGLDPEPFDAVTVILLLVTSILWQTALILHKPLEIDRRSRSMLIYMMVAIVVSIGLAVLLVPPLGGVGAACAALAGPATYLAFCAPSWHRMKRQVL